MNKLSQNKNYYVKRDDHLKNSKIVFHSDRFDVNSFEIAAKDGSIHKREAIIHPGAVVILPLVDPEKIVMIRNERFAIDETLWELPAGTMEKTEDPLETAKRELLEETGYQAGKIEHLISFYSTPGFCNEMLHAFVAKDLSFVGQKLEETEKISVEILNLKKLEQMIRKGEIHDAKTLTTLLYYMQFFGD